MRQQNNDSRVVRLEMTPAAKATIEQMCERYGMTQHAFGSRLLEWFCGQPELIRAFVLGAIPHEVQADLASVLLKTRPKR